MKLVRRPVTVPAEEVDAVERKLAQFDENMDEHIERLLNHASLDQIRRNLKNYVFTPSSALPKRDIRPHIKTTYVTATLSEALGSDEKTDDLVAFVILMTEYYDISDDIFDGDVAPGSEPLVYVTNETVVPLLSQFACKLGDKAVSYWAPIASEMILCFLDEHRHEPSASRYTDILDRSSKLYGVCTGLAATVAGAGETEIARAERFGKNYFKMEQICLDRSQATAHEESAWNAWYLMSDDDVLEYLYERRTEMEGYLDALPDEYGSALRPLVALDIEGWYRSS